MNQADPLRVLLVEDDEDDFVLTQSMLLANGRTKFDLEWEQSYASALDVVRLTSHDLYLVDYRLGEHTGLDLVRTAWGTDPPAPVILLTGQDDYAVDMEATALGVTDYLVKGTIDAPSLERTIDAPQPGADDPLCGPPAPGDGRPAAQRGALRRRCARNE
jgi:ActR/RegA family two-component response regulator